MNRKREPTAHSDAAAGSGAGCLPPVAIAADDLTGAADTLAAFSAAGWKCELALDVASLVPARPGVAQAIDTRSRIVPLAGQPDAVKERVVGHLTAAVIPFLKIDSLLRGNFASDVSFLASRWPRVVFTPAFPARRRQFGGQVVLATVAALNEQGLAAVHVRNPADARSIGAGLLVVESHSDSDLIVATFARGATLWVGSAGLAYALAGSDDASPPPRPRRREGSVLTVVGSRTDLAQRQVREALQGRPDLRHSSWPDISAGPGDLLVSIPASSGPDDVEVVRKLARNLDALDKSYRALVLVGGDTARAMLTQSGATKLNVVGQLEPGIALSVDDGGRTIVTKSGSFGDDFALRRVHEWLA